MPRLDIARLARLNGIRRTVVLRPILATAAQERALARIYMRPVRLWAEAARAAILPAYEMTLAELPARDGFRDSLADVQAEIARADAGAVRAALTWRELFANWVDGLARWHFGRFVAGLKYATGVDLGTVLAGPEPGVTETLETVLARNTALIRSVSDATRDRIAEIVLRGLQNRTPARDVAREIAEAVGFSRKRALRVAADQLLKAAAALDEQRLRDVGVEKFEWMHSAKAHPREWHKARDGKRFAWNDPAIATDKPGMAPFCGCKAKGVVEEAEDDADAPPPPRQAAPPNAPRMPRMPPPEPAPPAPQFAYQAFKPAKTVAEATDWIKANVAKNAIISKGVKLDGLNEIAQATQEANERFSLPPVFFMGDSVGVTFNTPAGRGTIKWPARAWATYAGRMDAFSFRNQGTDTKALAKSYDDNRQRSGRVYLAEAKEKAATVSTLRAASPELRAALDRMDAVTWVVVKDARGIAMHELGHRLHHMKAAEINNVLAGGAWKKEGWPLALSKYSETNPQEFIAESFALYMTEPSQHFRIYPPLLALFRRLDRNPP